MEEPPAITKEFLEEILKRKVESFSVKPGTNVGDNYTSVLYSIEAKLETENEGDEKTLHLISKCYPAHPARQIFLNSSNMFWNELSIYQVLIPELEEIAQEAGLGNKLPFPPLIGGKAINFEKLRKLGDTSLEGKVFNSFDIYIMMTDLRRTWGFRMADRQLGLDFDHVSLVIRAHAKLHALSWGYKQLNGGMADLGEKFEFLKFDMKEDDKAMWTQVMEPNIELAANTIAAKYGMDSSLVVGTRNLKNNIGLLFEAGFGFVSHDTFYDVHRLKPTPVVGEEPWKVLLHGDCWTNNLLFRYDEKTKRPLELILVDLQMMRDTCPTMDLVYLLYSSTTSEFRKEHLNTILSLYHSEFTNNCKLINVNPLPNFTLPELKRRFHRSKIFGYFLSTMCLPIMLKHAKDVTDPESVKGEDMMEMMKVFTEHHVENDIYSDRITSLAEEMHADGVL